MKLLLDTHIWIWMVSDPARLSARVKRSLANPKNLLWVSPISVWEIAVLVSKKRVSLDRPLTHWVRFSREELLLQEAPFSLEVALETQNISLDHWDPSDRFLAATARVYGLTLVTADEALIRASDVPTMPSR